MATLKFGDDEPIAARQSLVRETAEYLGRSIFDGRLLRRARAG